jgi:pimeloyl-ACP methyl ester carboxylesterase
MPHLEAADGTRLFYKDIGSGPPVVLVHSWSFSSSMWEYQIQDLLAAGHRCVAMDRRGHGRSDMSARGYDLDTLAGDLAALVEHLDLRGVTLVGHSMGTCEMTRHLAVHGCGRVARAVYLGAMTPYFVGAAGVGAVDRTVAALCADRPKWFRDGADDYFAFPRSGVSRALVDDGVTTILATPLEAQVSCLREFTATDLTPDLAAIRVPTLVIHGDADLSAPIDITGRPTAALLPDSRFELYPDAPHGLYVTEKDRLAKDLLEFIGETPA